MAEVRNYEGYESWDRVVPLPGSELMHWTGSPSLENFLLVGESWAKFIDTVMRERGMSGPRLLLDIGCGCGKTARQLLMNPNLSYIGFDIMKDAIVWSEQAFKSYADRYRFVHFDGISQHYNPGGTIRADEYVFPCGDGEADVIFAASLFTHLFENDCRHYLAQTARVMKPGGVAILSIHDDGPSVRYGGSEERVAIHGAYFNEMAAEVGLRFEGRSDNLCGQQIHMFTR